MRFALIFRHDKGSRFGQSIYLGKGFGLGFRASSLVP